MKENGWRQNITVLFTTETRQKLCKERRNKMKTQATRTSVQHSNRSSSNNNHINNEALASNNKETFL